MSFNITEYEWPAFQGRKPFVHQKHTVHGLIKHKRFLVLNDMGCVDADTEYLSPTGWRRIADYTGEDVAQWDEVSHKIDFVKPTEFIKRHCEEFICFAGTMNLSPEHRVVGRFKGLHGVKSAQDVHQGAQAELYRTFKAPDKSGLPYTNEVLRVIVAYIADGHIRNNLVYVRLKIIDKIDRMRQLLNESGIPYKETSYQLDGKTNFIFTPPILTQEFGPIFYSATESQLRIICDEVWRWNGRRIADKHQCWEFSTMRKISADFIQYAFSAIGHMASITQSSKQYIYRATSPRTRVENEITTLYIVRATMYIDKTEFTAGSSMLRIGDGFKYCFAVPKTFWLMRRHDKIIVTGNTGKTLAALWATDILMRAGKIKRVLIVGPLSTMKSVWYNEIFLNVPHRTCAIAHGTKQHRINTIKGSANFVIINHDGIKIVEDEIIAQQFDIILIDELTAFKSHSADRSKCMKRIADKQDKYTADNRNGNRARFGDGGVYGMTGEITPNSPLEAFFQIKIVNPHNEWLPRYFGQFRDACMFMVNEQLWLPKPEAAQIVAMCSQPSIRFTREQCLDLPDTMYQTIETELSADQIKFYNQMKKAALIETESGSVTAANAAVVMNKLLQISAGAVKNDVGDVVEIGCQDRIDQLMDIFANTPQKKLVVFATYRATIAMLEREFGKRGIKCAAIHGDVAQNLRASRIDDFQTGDLEVLVLQPQSSAHGITLTASSTIVWFSLMPSNELFQQGNARIVRAGQIRKTLIVMFVSTKVEKHVAKILQTKGDMSKEVLRILTNEDLL